MYIIGQILYILIQVLIYMMVARALLSWFVRDLSNPIVRFLYEVTEPLVSPVRQLMERFNLRGGMIDFSFMVTMILLLLVQQIVITIFF